MYALANRYQCDADMKDMCVRKFTAEAKLHLLDTHFTDACSFAFASTPASDRGLRDAVKKVVYNNITELMKCNSFKDRLQNVGPLAVEVLEHLLLTVGTTYPTFYCKACVRNTGVQCDSCHQFQVSLVKIM